MFLGKQLESTESSSSPSLEAEVVTNPSTAQSPIITKAFVHSLGSFEGCVVGMGSGFILVSISVSKIGIFVMCFAEQKRVKLRKDAGDKNMASSSYCF